MKILKIEIKINEYKRCYTFQLTFLFAKGTNLKKHEELQNKPHTIKKPTKPDANPVNKQTAFYPHKLKASASCINVHRGIL
jgi:hypothetical protein